MRPLVVALSLLAVAACSKKETPPPPPPATSAVFAEIAHITEVAADARFVYVASQSGADARPATDFFRIPKSGGKPEKLEALPPDAPRGLDGGVPPAPKLPEGTNVTVGRFASDATHLYVTTKPADGTDNEGDLLRLTVAGGEVETWVDKQNRPWAIALDANTVYWGTEDGLFKRDKTSTMVKTLLRGESVANTIAVDDRYVYWATRDRLMRVPKD